MKKATGYALVSVEDGALAWSTEAGSLRPLIFRSLEDAKAHKTVFVAVQVVTIADVRWQKPKPTRRTK
jgi:hypothetical protein